MEEYEKFIESVKSGDHQLVGRMLDRNPALVNLVDKNGTSAVLLAMYYGHPQLAEVLVGRGANLDIFEAAAVGKTARVADQLKEQPELANAYSADGYQPLGLACFFGHLETARLLLDRGSEVNSASTNPMRVMPLHSAAASRQLEIARMLMEHGAEVNARQADEFTPLHAAAQNGQLEMAEQFLTYGAEVNARNAAGQTALSIAIQNGQEEIADFLRRRGATE